MSNRVATVVHSVLGGVAVVALVAWQASLIDFWIAGLVIAACSMGSFAILRGVEREYREYVFQPLGPKDISPTLRRHFEQHTPALQQLGFQRVGDYLLLPPPIAESARVLISGDGECFASIVEHGDIRCLSFTSMTSDGIYFESTTINPGGEGPSPRVPLRAQFLGNRPAYEVNALHRQLLDAHRAAHDADVVVCGPEEFRHVFEYGHRLVGWDLFHKGRRRSAPPPLPDIFRQREPIGAAIHAASHADE